VAVTAHAYPQIQQKLATKAVNLSTDALKVMLLASYTPANTAGGLALTSVTFTTSAAVSTLTCANPSWAASTITAAYAVFYDSSGGTNATNFPIVYWDFGGNQSSSNGTFTLTINASGLYQVTSSF
jgi:hypothetical protein